MQGSSSQVALRRAHLGPELRTRDGDKQLYIPILIRSHTIDVPVSRQSAVLFQSTFNMLTQSTVFALLSAASSVAADVYTVPSQPNANGEPFDGFVSYSIEFSSFPDFAGKASY